MAKEKTYRARLIGMIHMQKSAAQLTNDEYRLILAGATGKQTCSECSIQELFAVHKDLNAVLIKQGKKGFIFFRNPMSKGKATIQDAVVAKAKKVLGDKWNERLDGSPKKLNRQRNPPDYGLDFINRKEQKRWKKNQLILNIY